MKRDQFPNVIFVIVLTGFLLVSSFSYAQCRGQNDKTISMPVRQKVKHNCRSERVQAIKHYAKIEREKGAVLDTALHKAALSYGVHPYLVYSWMWKRAQIEKR